MSATFRSTGLLKVYGAIGFIVLATQVYAEDHAHEFSEHNGGYYSLNHGKQWEGDKVLRHYGLYPSSDD